MPHNGTMRGGGGCSHGQSNPIAINYGNLWENCNGTCNPPKFQGNKTSGQLANVFPILRLGPKVLPLQEAALNVTMELKHETKAVDVVIQFVLTFGNSATL